MEFLRGRTSLLITLAAVGVLCSLSPAPTRGEPKNPDAGKGRKSKVIIYPKAGETIEQLKARGVGKVANYGSYWVVTGTDQEINALRKAYGNRVDKAEHLNRIELAAYPIDTTEGEPSVPDNLRETETAGKRLRLIQFVGPVQPQWLEQVKAAGDVKVVNYVPHNAYLLWLDGEAEAKLRKLMEPDGPIQWIGAYHPYYKIPKHLRTNETPGGSPTIDVVVGLVEHEGTEQTIQSLSRFGFVQRSDSVAGQRQVTLTISRGFLAALAQLPDVLWVDKIEPKVLLDEVQGLITARFTNNIPGNGPFPPLPSPPGTNYLQWLTDTVGGGLLSFTNPAAYPIVDIADTGFGNEHRQEFNVLGDPFGQSRVVYDATYADCGFVGSGNNSVDLYGHGTVIATILAGFDTNVSEVVTCIYNRVELQTFRSSTNTCLGTGNTNMVFTFPDVPPSGCTTTLQFTCSGPGADAFVDRDFPVTVIQTQTFTRIRQDPSGFQLGLGISPFGQFGTTRVWAQNATLLSSPTRIRLSASTFCNELPPTTAFDAYSSGARIQNNSWSDGLTINNGGQYNANAQAFDVAVRDALPVGTGQPVPGPSALNQEFIVVFAANSGLCDAGTSGNVGGFGDIRVTSPSTAKNILTVGSSENVRLDGSGCAVPVNQDNSLDIFQDSAFGPTLDGRFKPEIVAPGTSVYGVLTSYGLGVTPQNALQIISQTGPCLGLFNEGFWTETNAFNACVGITNFGQTVRSPAVSEIGELCAGAFVEGVQLGQTGLYECRSGSSYAAPAVSGAIQLLWWYFQNRLTNEVGTALFQPSPAMAKAYLLNSARYLPLTNPQTGAKDTLPSSAQGMGILDLARMFDGVSRVIRDQSAPRAIDPPITTTNPAPQQTYFSQSGQSYELKGVVASNDLPFRVTLAWTDTPGNPSSFLQLVNDLDLEVTVNGTTYKGNVFAEDHSVAGGGFDFVNNVESVFLPAGSVSAGTPYTIKIRAINIAGDGVPNVGGAVDQDFALVVYNSQTNFASLSDVPNLATNNACQTAIEILGFPFVFTNFPTKSIYHNTHPSPTAAEGGVDEFFKIPLPPAGALFTIDTAGSTFSNVLSVWRVESRAGCGALTEVSSDVAGGLTNVLTFVASGVDDYYVVVEPLNDILPPGARMVLNISRVAPSVALDPVTINFSNQVVGSTSVTAFVSIKNTGVLPVTVNSVAMAGINPTEFLIVTNPCTGASILPGEACNLAVAFRPTTLGLRTAQLRVSTSETNVPHVAILSGTGVLPSPIIATDRSQLSFPDQAVGTTSVVQSVTLTNIGSGNLIISSITPVGGCCSNDFFVTSSTCLGTPIPSNGTCTINIQFTPTGNGPRGSLLQIISNAGTGTNTALVLLGTGVSPAISTIPTGLNFGTQLVNVVSAPLSVIVQNTGNAPLTITSLTVGGTNAADFIINTNFCLGTPIAPGDACGVSVTFRPGALGPRNATLNIAGNATNSPVIVALAGVGGTGLPSIDFIPAVLPTFGNWTVGTTSTPQTIIVTNRGTSSLLITNIALAGSNPGDFLLSTNTCLNSPVPPGGSCTVQVLFTPQASGDRLADVVFFSNSGGSPHSYRVKGAGIAPGICPNPSVLTFGAQPVNITSAPLPLTILNCGNAPLVITNIAVESPDAGDFSITNNTCLGAPIAPGDACSLSVTFRPGALGPRNAQLRIWGNATNSPVTVLLSGTGTNAAPSIGFSPTSLSFGNQPVGSTSAVQTVTITNAGNASLIISAIFPNGGFSSDYTVTNNTCTVIPAGGSCSVGVLFHPSATGPRPSAVRILSNSGSGINDVPITGNGTAPAMVLQPSSLNYGTQAVSVASVPQFVFAQSVGDAPLVITNVAVIGTNSTDFIVTNNPCVGVSLPPGDSCGIGISFRPSGIGVRTAQLVVFSTATNSPQVATLTGVGATNVPAIAINPLSLTFADQLVGTTSAVQQITISNPGTASLAISDTAFVGGNTDSFVIVNNTCQSGVIPPGGNCVIGIASAPKVSGPLSTTLRILHNAGNGTNTVAIFGSGIAPAITFIPDPLDFGSNAVGVASVRTLTVLNSGNAQLIIPTGAVVIAGSSPGDYTNVFITCTNAPILPGQSCVIGVRFRPTATLQRNAQLVIFSNATNSPAIATLTGIGILFSCPTITVSPSVLPNPIIGAAYSNQLFAAGGTEPYTFVVSAGALPPGLSLSLGGLISGTPTTAGAFNFTVLATDTNGCTGAQGYTVTVACPTITVLPATPTLPSATAGATYNQQLSAISSGGDTQFVFTVVAGSLPPGLTLTGGGLLSGTPTTVGVFSFTVQAANPQGCVGTQTYSITVNCANVTLLPVTLQNGVVGVAYFQTNSVVGGVPPYTFFVAGGSLPPGLTYSTNGVISGAPTLAGSFNFTAAALDANGCLASRAYTLVVGCGQLPLLPVTLPDAVVGASYSQTIQVSGRTNGVVFTRTSGTMPPGLTLGTNGVISGTPTRAGLGLSPFSFQVSALDLSNNCTYSRFYTIKVVCPTIGVLPAALPVGSFGDPYSVQLTATGGVPPYVFAQTAGALPAGISLSTNGLLSGTLMSGSSPFTVTVTDSNGCTASVQYTLTVANSCPTITLNPASLPTAVAGQPYSQTLTASGGTGPYTFSVVLSSLPSGLTLSPAGVLSGTPTATGTVTFTVQALDSVGCKGFRAYTLDVVCDTILVSPVSLPTGTVTVAYSQLLSASGGVAPYTFAVTSGSLPAGFSLTSGGLLSGTTTNAGTFAFTVTATDAAGCSASRLYSLAINPSADLAVSVTDAPDPSAVGSNITYVITVTNRGPSVATSVVLSNVFSAAVTNVVTACSVSGNNIVCALGTLPAGGSVTVTNRVSPLTSGLLTNTVTVSSAVSDLVPANNTALAVTTVNPAVGFAATTELVNAGAGEAVVNVRRLGKADAVVTVQYATSDDTAVAGADYVATSGVLSFDLGVSERSIRVPLIQSGAAGLKTAKLQLSNPTGGAVLGPRATVKIDILNSPKAATPLTFNDADGDVVTVRVNGAGKAQVSLLGDDHGPVGQITLTGADAKSTLTVTVKRGATGNGQVDIGGIGAGSLKAINAKSANVTGAGIQLDGALGNLNVNAIRNSAISAAGGITAVNAKEISGSLITAGFAPSNASDPMGGGSFENTAQIKSVKAGLFGNSTIAAAQIGAVKLGTVPTDNGGHAFGVLARDAIGSVKIAQPKSAWNSAGPADWAVGDFHVKH